MNTISAFRPRFGNQLTGYSKEPRYEIVVGENEGSVLQLLNRVLAALGINKSTSYPKGKIAFSVHLSEDLKLKLEDLLTAIYLELPERLNQTTLALQALNISPPKTEELLALVNAVHISPDCAEIIAKSATRPSSPSPA